VEVRVTGLRKCGGSDGWELGAGRLEFPNSHNLQVASRKIATKETNRREDEARREAG